MPSPALHYKMFTKTPGARVGKIFYFENSNHPMRSDLGKRFQVTVPFDCRSIIGSPGKCFHYRAYISYIKFLYIMCSCARAALHRSVYIYRCDLIYNYLSLVSEKRPHPTPANCICESPIRDLWRSFSSLFFTPEV